MALKLEKVQLEDFETMAKDAEIHPVGDDLVGMPTPLCWLVSSQQEAQERLQFHMAKQRARFLGDPTATYLKVVDSDTNQIISIARWHYYPNGYSYDTGIAWEIYSPVIGVLFPQAMNIELHNFILSARDAERKNWTVQNAPCWILMHLITRGSQRGRGAAGMLIDWGVEKARRDGVPAYLEAGAMARPIYEKRGFEQIGKLLELNLRPYGIDMDMVMANMGIHPRR